MPCAKSVTAMNASELDSHMAAITRKKLIHKEIILQLSPKHRVFMKRALVQKETLTTLKKGKGTPKEVRGRKARCAGKCLACVKRFHGEPGGPAHVRDLCGAIGL